MSRLKSFAPRRAVSGYAVGVLARSCSVADPLMRGAQPRKRRRKGKRQAALEKMFDVSGTDTVMDGQGGGTAPLGATRIAFAPKLGKGLRATKAPQPLQAPRLENTYRQNRACPFKLETPS